MAQKIEVISPFDLTEGGQKKDKEKSDKPVIKARRKGVDKWKKKVWYTILAPEEFERRPLGETIAELPELLIGRTVSITGRELANQPKKSHIHLKFKVTSVTGTKAATEAIGHEIKDGYMRRVVRRHASKIMSVRNYSSKDAKKFKIKTIIVTERKASRIQKASIRRKAEEITARAISEIESRKIVDELVFGSLANRIFPEIKRIVPIKRIEITNSTLLVTK